MNRATDYESSVLELTDKYIHGCELMRQWGQKSRNDSFRIKE